MEPEVSKPEVSPRTWADRIAAARQRGSFTPDDRADAAGWRRCALGEALPGHGLFAEDRFDHAADLAARFGTAVTENDMDGAAALYSEIRAEVERLRAVE